MRSPKEAWWAPEWRRADVIVLNFGHHFRNVDGSFNLYYRVVLDAIAAARDLGKPTAQVIFRTSNVGHHQCEQAADPLPSRAAAWQQLGGWAWTPPTQTPEWFGKARQGQGVADKYDWRAPALHETEWAKQFGFSALGKGLGVDLGLGLGCHAGLDPRASRPQDRCCYPLV